MAPALVNACRPRHMHLHIFYVFLFPPPPSSFSLFLQVPFLQAPLSCLSHTLSLSLCTGSVQGLLLGHRGFFFSTFGKGGLFRKHYWKATAADSWVIKDLERRGFSCCVFFQAFFVECNGLLALSEKKGIESRAMGQPSGLGPILQVLW